MVDQGLRVFDGGHPSINALPDANTKIVVPKIMYRSQVMHNAVEQARRFAQCNATVLLNGESGTGKELFARLICDCSLRCDKVFSRVNCAALSESLIESELFGHTRGAFTGATEDRVGRFEWANGGTLLLDEISEIPISIQAKLLRVLEENEFQRVGSNETIRTDVRIVATSNRNLLKEVKDGNFREDLYHRLNVLQLRIPPLRERVEDVSLLTNLFIKAFHSESRINLKGATPESFQKLAQYDWPGNVRQLRNTVHRACVLATGELIEPSDLPEFETVESTSSSLPNWVLELTLDEVERRMILENLRRSGNKTTTASKLGVTSRTLSNKIKLYEGKGISRLVG